MALTVGRIGQEMDAIGLIYERQRYCDCLTNSCLFYVLESHGKPVPSPTAKDDYQRLRRRFGKNRMRTALFRRIMSPKTNE